MRSLLDTGAQRKFPCYCSSATLRSVTSGIRVACVHRRHQPRRYIYLYRYCSIYTNISQLIPHRSTYCAHQIDAAVEVPFRQLSNTARLISCPLHEPGDVPSLPCTAGLSAVCDIFGTDIMALMPSSLLAELTKKKLLCTATTAYTCSRYQLPLRWSCVSGMNVFFVRGPAA